MFRYYERWTISLEVKTTQRVTIGGVREKGKMIKNDQIENDQPIAIEETGI